MTPTPEQIAQSREEFEMQLLPATEIARGVLGKYYLNGLENQWQEYIRIHTEQADFMPITADDVSYKMMVECNNNADTVLSPTDFAAAVNAYMGEKK